jgi:hypothetical protein
MRTSNHRVCSAPVHNDTLHALASRHISCCVLRCYQEDLCNTERLAGSAGR